MHPVHKSRSVPLASLVSSPADSPFSGLCSTSISPEKGVYRWCSCLFVSRVNSDSNPLLLASQGGLEGFGGCLEGLEGFGAFGEFWSVCGLANGSFESQ